MQVRLAPTDLLREIIEPAWKMLGMQQNLQGRLSRLTLERRVAPGVPETLLTDTTRCLQVVGNLLHNAAKFTKDGGSITLDVSLVTKPVARSSSSSAEGAGPAVANGGSLPPVTTSFVQFVVADTGIGVPPGKLNAIFEAFVQADDSANRCARVRVRRAQWAAAAAACTVPNGPLLSLSRSEYQGTGIGLAIGRKIADALNGSLECHSEGVGRGATFTFCVPATAPPEQLQQHSQRDEEAKGQGGDGTGEEKPIPAEGGKPSLSPAAGPSDDSAEEKHNAVPQHAAQPADVAASPHARSNGSSARPGGQQQQHWPGEKRPPSSGTHIAGVAPAATAAASGAAQPAARQQQQLPLRGASVVATAAPASLENVDIDAVRRRLQAAVGRRAAAASGALPTSAARGGEQPLQVKRVLVADDDRTNRMLMKRVLDKFGALLQVEREREPSHHSSNSNSRAAQGRLRRSTPALRAAPHRCVARSPEPATTPPACE